MKKNPRTKQQPQPLAEIEDLRRRLEEAKETLRAIQEGEVDALVLSKPQGEVVFTLKGAESPYRVFVEAMNEGAITLDPEGTILYCNARFAEMLRIPADKVIGSSIHRFIPSTDIPGFQSAFQGGQQRNTTADISLKREDQVLIPVHLSFNMLHGQDVPVVCMVAMDLTEHKRLDEALRQLNADLEKRVRDRTAELTKVNETLQESEQRWATTLASIGDAVIATDEDGRIRFMNAVAEGLTGWTLSEASRKPVKHVFKIINEHTHLEVEDPVAKVIETGMICGLANHTLLVRKDGTEVAIDDSGAPIRDETGKIMGVVLVFRDISERRQADEALRESESRFRAIFESSMDAIFVTDPKGKGTILSANPAACRILDRTEEELIGKDREFILNIEDPRLTSFLQGREEYGGNIGELTHKRKDGSKFPGELTTGIFQDSKGKERAVAIIRDITERKRAEEELRRSRDELEMRVQERTSELAKANKTLQELSSRLLSAQEDERKRIGGELHDTIGSCLNGINFKVEMALKQLGKTTDVAAKSLSGVIPLIHEGIEECRRMQQDLRPSILDDLGLLAALSWFCRRYQTIYTGIKVELEQTLEERDIPNALKIVIFRVTQEGMNNIAKHSKASVVQLSLGKMDGRIELVLKDNGQGFDLKKVLASESTKRGLGLTSMRERTELSGGSFVIESEEGKGTTIRAEWSI